jgi:AcrR family transcriptional regulator
VTEGVKRGDTAAGGRASQARTQLARRAVVDAAGVLFVKRGYAATTIEAVSERSGVSPATVYRLFASKLGILKAVLDTAIAGDDRPVAVAERPEVGILHAQPDPRELLAGFSAVVIAINQRIGDVYRVLVSAAGSDPDAAALLVAIQQQREAGQRQFARTLGRSGALRAGLAPRAAADIIYGLASPELYRLFVGDRGWTPTRYQSWLSRTLAEALLPPLPDNA